MSVHEIIRLRKPTDRARQRSKFEEVLREMNELELNEQMTFQGKNRQDTSQIKRHAHIRFPNKWFDIFGRTEQDGHYWIYITLTNTQVSTMTLKAIDPVADVDIEQVLYFRQQKVVRITDPLNREEHEHIVIAKHANGKAYIIHNFGRRANLAKKATKALSNLLAAVCDIHGKPTVQV